ncbi:hypothetical protein ACHAP8_010041 [Fusarium lateritium]
MSTPPAAATSPKSEKSEKSPAKSRTKSPSKSPSQEAQASVGITGVLEPEHWQQLAEEEENLDDDAHSLSEESLNSSTASVTSSIFEYRKLHGRTYHREIGSAQYW